MHFCFIPLIAEREWSDLKLQNKIITLIVGGKLYDFFQFGDIYLAGNLGQNFCCAAQEENFFYSNWQPPRVFISST